MKSASRKLKPPTIIQLVLPTNETLPDSVNGSSHPHTTKLDTGFGASALMAIIYTFSSHELFSSWVSKDTFDDSILVNRMKVIPKGWCLHGLRACRG